MFEGLLWAFLSSSLPAHCFCHWSRCCCRSSFSLFNSSSSSRSNSCCGNCNFGCNLLPYVLSYFSFLSFLLYFFYFLTYTHTTLFLTLYSSDCCLAFSSLLYYSFLYMSYFFFSFWLVRLMIDLLQGNSFFFFLYFSTDGWKKKENQQQREPKVENLCIIWRKYIHEITCDIHYVCSSNHRTITIYHIYVYM